MSLIKIAHRINTIDQIKNTNKALGIEIDIRPYGKDLVVHHDPFMEAIKLEELLVHYNQSFLIANVKAEGIEKRVIELINKFGIKNYFLLDVSLPFLVKMTNEGFKNLAVRYSEYEPLDFTLRFAGLVEWVWVDCFTHLPLNEEIYTRLKKHFKICLVSPELQGHETKMINTFREQIKAMDIDAVCTKRTDLW